MSKKNGTEPKLLRETTRALSCKLTDDEVRQSGEALAALVEDMANEEARATDVKQQLKARMTELESKRYQLASKVRRREEIRDVAVKLLLHENNLVHIVRTDTAEVIETRPATDRERQPDLPLEGAGAQA